MIRYMLDNISYFSGNTHILVKRMDFGEILYLQWSSIHPKHCSHLSSFQPSTPLEQEVYKILHGSKFAERPNKQLSQAEEEAIKAMSLSEV